MVAPTIRAFELYNSNQQNNASINKAKYLMGDFSLFGVPVFQLGDRYRYMDDYLRNRNMDWSDMKYPSIAFNHGNLRFNVSKNVSKLYK